MLNVKNFKQLIGILRWLPEYKKPGVIRADILAGLTGAIVVLPQGFAFAILAGMPPHYGLYAAIMPCIVAALLGSSRLMVTGPATAISLSTLALLSPLATPATGEYILLAITLSFFVGLAQFLCGVIGVGKLVERVPHAVIVGFTAGAAVLIMNSQIGIVLGVSIPRGASVVDTVLLAYQALVNEVWHPEGGILASITLIVIRLWRKWNSYVPAILIAVIIGSLAALCMEYFHRASGPFILRVTDVPSPIPPLSLPSITWQSFQQILFPCLVMFLLASTEAMAIARALALKKNEYLDANREFMGQGLANIAGSFFSAYPASGSFNRSGVNLAAGAVTPFAAICAAVFLVVILTFFGAWAVYLPYAVIGALLLFVAWNLIKIREIEEEFRAGILHWPPMVVTFLGTVFYTLEWAVIAGLGVAVFCQAVQRWKNR